MHQTGAEKLSLHHKMASSLCSQLKKVVCLSKQAAHLLNLQDEIFFIILLWCSFIRRGEIGRQRVITSLDSLPWGPEICNHAGSYHGSMKAKINSVSIGCFLELFTIRKLEGRR